MSFAATRAISGGSETQWRSNDGPIFSSPKQSYARNTKSSTLKAALVSASRIERPRSASPRRHSSFSLRKFDGIDVDYSNTKPLKQQRSSRSRASFGSIGMLRKSSTAAVLSGEGSTTPAGAIAAVDEDAFAVFARILAISPGFEDFPGELLRKLFRASTLVKFRPGTPVLEDTFNAPKTLYIVQKGEVRSFDGRLETGELFFAGDVFGEDAMLDPTGAPRRRHVSAGASACYALDNFVCSAALGAAGKARLLAALRRARNHRLGAGAGGRRRAARMAGAFERLRDLGTCAVTGIRFALVRDATTGLTFVARRARTAGGAAATAAGHHHTHGDWVRRREKKSGRRFYANTKTHATQWEKPGAWDDRAATEGNGAVVAAQLERERRSLERLGPDAPFVVTLVAALSPAPGEVCLITEPTCVFGRNLYRDVVAPQRARRGAGARRGGANQPQLLPDSAVRFYVASVAEALAFMHARNVVHRDVKTKNCYLAPNGYLQLAEFGVARLLPAEGRTRTVCGTPAFCAPEVFDRADRKTTGYGKAADWWSAGVLAFELLFGRTPWQTTEAGRRATKKEDTFDAILRYCEAAHLGRDVGGYFRCCRDNDAQRAFLRLLLEPNPRRRGGYGAQHGRHSAFVSCAFFADFDFGALVRQELAAPVMNE